MTLPSGTGGMMRRVIRWCFRSVRSTVTTLLVAGGLLAVALGAWLSGDVEDTLARYTQEDDAERAVRSFLDDLVKVGKAPEGQRGDLLRTLDGRMTGAVGERDRALWEVGVDPYVWSRLELDADRVTDVRATVGPVAGTTWAVRRAKSGCWELRGDFEVERDDEGVWRVDRLPAFSRRCDDASLRATWKGSDADQGVLEWSGTYQRVDPLTATYSNPTHVKQHENYDRAWSARKTIDVERIVTPDGHLAYDGDLSSAWGVPSPLRYTGWATSSWGSLTYKFAETTRLLRVRLHNGALSAGTTAPGRIKWATLRAGGREVHVLLWNRLGTQRIECDFGRVRELELEVNEIWPTPGLPPQESDVALSHIDFWGLPVEARVAAPPPTGPVAWTGDPRSETEEVSAPCRADLPSAEVVNGVAAGAA